MQTTRRSFLKTALGAVSAVTACSFLACAEKKHPNVLFIAVDDMKPILGCYGDKEIQTPNIDRLAARGTVFMNNHCQQAVCGPTRASLLTGLYPDEDKTWGFTMIREAIPDILTLPEYFKNKGYTTINISKIFDYRTVDKFWDKPSWTEAFPLSEEALNPYYDKQAGPVLGYFYHSPLVKKAFERTTKQTGLTGAELIQAVHNQIKPATECLDLPDNAYKDGVFADKAVMDLERLSHDDKPFFLAVGFERPHLPFTAPKKYWDLYDPQEIELAAYQQMAENDKAYYYTTSPELRSYTAENGDHIYAKLEQGEKLTPAEQARLIHGYRAAVSYIDAQIGKVLDKLEQLQLRDDTIVVLWGDHGWHLGDHNVWGKATNFEQATHAPLIFAVPGQIPNSTHQPTGFIDIFPTLCRLTGLDVPEHVAGSSLVDLIQGKPDTVHRYAVSQYPRGDRMGYTVRDERYRYVEWIEPGLHVDPNAKLDHVVDKQLFDYQTDPLETMNMADQPACKDVQTVLAGYLREHLDKVLAHRKKYLTNE